MNGPDIDKITVDISDVQDLIDQITERQRKNMLMTSEVMREQMQQMEAVIELEAILTGQPRSKKH